MTDQPMARYCGELEAEIARLQRCIAGIEDELRRNPPRIGDALSICKAALEKETQADQEKEHARLRELKTPATRQLLNVTKAMLDSAEQEAKELRAAPANEQKEQGNELQSGRRNT